LVLAAAINNYGFDPVLHALPDQRQKQFKLLASAVSCLQDAAVYHENLERTLAALPAFLRLVTDCGKAVVRNPPPNRGELASLCEQASKVIRESILQPAPSALADYSKVHPLLFLINPAARLELLKHLYTPESIEAPLNTSGDSFRKQMEGSFRILHALANNICSNTQFDTLSDPELKQRSVQLSGLLAATRLLALENVRRYLSDTDKMLDQLTTKLRPTIAATKDATDATNEELLAEIFPITIALATLPPFDKRLKTQLLTYIPLTKTPDAAQKFITDAFSDSGGPKSKETALLAICTKIALAYVNGTPKHIPLTPLIKRLSSFMKLVHDRPYIILQEENCEKEIPLALRSQLSLFGAAVQVLPPTLRFFSVILEDLYRKVLEKGVLATMQESAPKPSARSDGGTTPSETDLNPADFAQDVPASLDSVRPASSEPTARQPTRASTPRTADHRLLKRLYQEHSLKEAKQNDRAVCLDIIKTELFELGGLTQEQIGTLALENSPHTVSLEAWSNFSNRLSDALPLAQMAALNQGQSPLPQVLCSAPWLLAITSNHFETYANKLAAVSASLLHLSDQVPVEYRLFSPSAKHPEYSILHSPENFRQLRDLDRLKKRIDEDKRNLADLTSSARPLHPVVVNDVLHVIAVAEAEADVDKGRPGFTIKTEHELPLAFTEHVVEKSMLTKTALASDNQKYLQWYKEGVCAVYVALGRNLTAPSVKKGRLSTLALNREQKLPENATPYELLLKRMLETKIAASKAATQPHSSSPGNDHQTAQPVATMPRRTRLDNSEMPLTTMKDALSNASF
jgi:hypothetical protein